jgi:hypothetical protein
MTTQISQPLNVPTQISGCALWLDAYDVSTINLSGSNVIRWNDKSGGGFNATQTSNYYPTYNSGTRTISCSNDGTNPQWLDVPQGMQTTQPVSIFVVVSWTQYSANGTTFLDKRKAASLTPLYQISGGGVLFRDNSTLTATSWTLPQSTRSIIGVQGNLNTEQTYVNGSRAASSNNSFNMPAADTFTFRIGALNDPTDINNVRTFSASSLINEVIVYNAFSSTAQRQQVEGYLAWKWGLISSLPTGHPFKTTPYFPFPITLAVPTLTNNTFFQPTQVSGCALWLDGADASTVVCTGANVTQWTDKSGNGRSPTGFGSTTLTTINATTAITLNGTDTYFYFSNATPMNNTPNLTAFVVGIFGSGMSSTERLLGFGNIDWNNGVNCVAFGKFSGVNRISYERGGTTVSGSVSITPPVSFVGSVVFTSSNVNQWVNGTINASGTYSFATFNYNLFNIGRFSGGGLYWRGAIGEVIAYNSALSTTQRQQIEGYLAWKWGLQSSLPAGHPYQTVPVNYTPTFAVPSVFVPQFAFKSWQPTQISALSLWLDAADTATLTLSGTNVSQWNDKSGNGRNATATTPPTYNAGTKSVVFNGTTQFMSLPNGTLGTGSTTYSCFFVASTNAPNSPQWVLVQGTTEVSQFLGFFFWATQALFHSWWINEYAFNNVTSASTNIIAGFTYNGTTRLTFANGISSAPNTPGLAKNTTANDALIGKRAAGEFLNGTISEIIFYTQEITTAQRQQVEGYLAWKWGLQSSLPGTHPFKKFPPPP